MGSFLQTLTSEDFGNFKDLKGNDFRISRDELFVTTKNGYIPDDSDNGIPATVLIEQLIEQGQLTKEDVAGGIHSMHPNYLRHQFK